LVHEIGHFFQPTPPSKLLLQLVSQLSLGVIVPECHVPVFEQADP
jgi:hypothetical protein